MRDNYERFKLIEIYLSKIQDNYVCNSENIFVNKILNFCIRVKFVNAIIIARELFISLRHIPRADNLLKYRCIRSVLNTNSLI